MNNKFEINKIQDSNVIELKPKIGRNDPCYCGSGKKYKNCCMKKDQEEELFDKLAKQKQGVPNNYFTVKEYIELFGYPLKNLDFFLMEMLNITGDVLHNYNKMSSKKEKEILKELCVYSKKFYDGCLDCENKCLDNPLKQISFKSLIDEGLDIKTLPSKLQNQTPMNFFYIEFINNFSAKIQEELNKKIENENELVYQICTEVYWTLADFIQNNCYGDCNNKCILNYEENAYCSFCAFAKKKLPCPVENEISYDEIKASKESIEKYCLR